MELNDNIVRRTIEAIRQPWWKPADPVLMDMLSEKNADKNRRIVRWGLWVAAIVNACFIVLDYYLLPDVSAKLIAIRLLAAVIFISLIEFAARTHRSLPTMHIIAAVAIVFAAVGWLIFALGSADQVILSQFMVFGTIFVLGANLFFNFRFWLSAITSAIVTIAFVYALIFELDVAVVARTILSIFFVSTLLFSLYLSWRMAREHYLTFLHQLQAEFQEQIANEKGEQLKKITYADPLTGLFNRRSISREFLNIGKQGLSEDEQAGVILLDVDYFDEFTVKFGGNAGDECLIRIAEALSQTAHASNSHAIAGRYGAAEFIVLCKIGSVDELRLICRQLCQAVEHLQIDHPTRGDKMKIATVSAGATMTRNDGSMDLTLLLQQADRALYAAQFGDRGSFSIFDPDNANDNPSGENLTELLKLAVSRRRVSLVYQPIQDCRTGHLIGHETLMRLRDFDGTAISPVVFIPVAEQTGAIVELGMWALEQACEDMMESGLGDVVSVNVSAVQLKTPDFPRRVQGVLERAGMTPSKLAIEVTEGIDILIETQVKKNLEALSSLGVQIWLDDFGTGFAGLAWLRQFDFDVVKIDRAFLSDTNTSQGFNFFQDTVRLIRNLGLSVLAEGVETQEQRDLLKRVGVNAMQGYFLGRPAPIADIDAARKEA